MDTPRGFSKLDFDFHDHHHHHDEFDHHDFDIERMGKLAPITKVDLPPLPLTAFFPVDKLEPKISGGVDGGSSAKNVDNPVVKSLVTEEVRRIDTVPAEAKSRSEGKKKKFSVEEHREIRRYGVFPTPLLKRSLADGGVAKALVGSGTKGAEIKKLRVDPVSGSLTDKTTGKIFKIFGILVDS